MYVISMRFCSVEDKRSLLEHPRKLKFLDLKTGSKYLLSKEGTLSQRQKHSVSFRKWILPNSKETGSYKSEL